MKSFHIFILLSFVSFSFQIPVSELPVTPKAADLNDHFGTALGDNIYGPKHTKAIGLREGVDPYHRITPIENYNEINPSQVASGQLYNTAYDASKIVSPEYAPPKLIIDSNYHHEAIINTPVQLGTQKITKAVEVYDRITGRSGVKSATKDVPIVGMMKNLRGVNTKAKSIVDLSTGKVLSAKPQIGYVGV